jgi:hypothetical protein
MELGGFNDIATMQQQLRQWLNEELAINNRMRDKSGSESLAVGLGILLKKYKPYLAYKPTNRKVTEIVDKHALSEPSARYNIVFGIENTGLRLNNRLLWDYS